MIVAAAGPAAANPAPPDIGLLSGVATVGKFATTCTKTGGGSTSGGGLGFPLVSDTKNAHYHLATPVTSVTHGTGWLHLCGFLEPTLTVFTLPGQVKPGVGAACGMSKGHGGQGNIAFGGAPVWLNNVGWKSSAAGFLPVTCEVNTDESKGSNKCSKKDGQAGSMLVAAIIAQGGSDCWTKPLTGSGSPPPEQGRHHVVLRVSVYSVMPVQYLGLNLLPLTGKMVWKTAALSSPRSREPEARLPNETGNRIMLRFRISC